MSLPSKRPPWMPPREEPLPVLPTAEAAAAEIERRYEAFRKEPDADLFWVALTTKRVYPRSPVQRAVMVVQDREVLARIEQRFSAKRAEWIVGRRSDDRIEIASTATFQIALKHQPPRKWEGPPPYRWVGFGKVF